MLETDLNNGRKGFVAELSTALHKRVENAVPIELFSERDGKKVELAEDITGYRFVRRTYNPDDLTKFAIRGLIFEDAVAAMQRDFARADLGVVPNFIVNPQIAEDEPLVIVTKYLKDVKPVADASIDTKTALARGIGNLLTRAEEIFPRPQMLQADMFQVVQAPNGGEKALLTDIDPYVMPLKLINSSSELKDRMTAVFIDRAAELFFDDFTDVDEKYQVLGALESSIYPVIDSVGMITLKSFGNLNIMKQGLDPR